MIPTVKVKSDKGRVPYRIINESDFDPKKHELFEPKAEKAEKDEFDAMSVKQLQEHLTAAKVAFETDANKASLQKLARDHKASGAGK